MSLFGQASGLGGFLFEISFDKFQHVGVLPFCIALFTYATTTDAKTGIGASLGLTLRNLRRITLSGKGFEVVMGSSSTPNVLPAIESSAATHDGPGAPSSPQQSSSQSPSHVIKPPPDTSAT